MIELSDADFQYDGEDITGVAIAQVVSLVAAGSAVIMLASYNVGIVDGFGAPLRIAFSGVLGPALEQTQLQLNLGDSRFRRFVIPFVSAGQEAGRHDTSPVDGSA